MKKRILIGIIAGTAMMSAQASNVYDNKEKGTKVDITGSLRLMLEDSSKRGRTDGDSDSKLKDEGSRVGVKYVQRLTQEVDAIGYFEYGGSTIVMFFPPNIMIDEDILRQSQAGYETQVFIGDKIGQRKE